MGSQASDGRHKGSQASDGGYRHQMGVTGVRWGSQASDGGYRRTFFVPSSVLELNWTRLVCLRVTVNTAEQSSVRVSNDGEG